VALASRYNRTVPEEKLLRRGELALKILFTSSPLLPASSQSQYLLCILPWAKNQGAAALAMTHLNERKVAGSIFKMLL
jgi:hypothetical protein